ncbi:hypothetical protein PF005_g5015 [Phytophthora fragariae]|uniref:Uncharacterized protein n=1 Tax=Phytophthora fragariae TaxID=53985 RepID=A0A6A3LTJ6_9STRA|nr:hypothetical protein PF003_g34710 [Phytophthora fragariae]KAE8945377.1 hypothetical protein PF009_g4959 [Phytophthora fragariae]KAE9022579.1 hypothetical protein PF011_g4396 [Phytophthora fragariae]KAE9127469.1 hypothetical protein PF007_g5609 [Phytophthora fragariae]KAE9129649.1 hypothetical protein PF010_g4117 [Phytophthora fragariae]
MPLTAAATRACRLDVRFACDQQGTRVPDALTISDPSFPVLATRAKWAKLYTQVTANIDVAIGVAFILEMLTPARTFLLLVLYRQVLRVRYMIPHQLQEGLRALHATILTVVNPLCYPTVIGIAYDKIHAFAVKMGDAVQQHQQAAPGAGLASRCNVM